VHPGQDLDMFCVDCQKTVCIKCVMTKHKPHTTKDLHEAADEARKQLGKDAARLQQAVDYMIGEVEAEKGEERALGEKNAALEAQIHGRCDMLSALVEQLRQDSLASLKDTRNVIQQDIMNQTGVKQSKLDQLL
jgi:hypothetical protein